MHDSAVDVGHITCLLGHNGAGKTTTIAALTGLVSATAGEVSIYGKSLKNDLYAIRQMTGVWYVLLLCRFVRF